MTAQVRRYKQDGPQESVVSGGLPGGATVSSFTIYAPAIMDAALSDDAAAADLDGILAADYGWTLYDVDPVATAAKTIVQIVPAALSADASSIAVADGWTDVLTASLTTKGGTSVGVQVTSVASAGIGEGQVRLLIDGGSFSNQVLGADYHGVALLSRATVAFHCPVTIPSTSGTTYTFKLQMQATGTLGTIIPRKGCVLTCVEYL